MMEKLRMTRFGPVWEVVLLVVLSLGSRPALAQPNEATEEEVRFSNGSVELAGTVIVPASGGPHPALVFLHGSGPATREGARPYAEVFAQLGLASLIFDKRGAGESGGSWITSSLEDLAGDALAAVDHLRTRPEIDPERIGFWGVSQAGWVATLAAARSPDVGFMILISGGGAAPRESEMYSYRKAFEAADLSDAEIAEAERALTVYFDYLATGEDRARVVAMIEQAEKNSAWYPHATLGRIMPSEENRANWSWVATWDPAPHMRQLRIPMLLLFGALDRNHPTEQAVQEWREGLQRAGNDRATVLVFPDAGHGIRLREGHGGHGRAPFADGYREVQVGWLWLNVTGASR